MKDFSARVRAQCDVGHAYWWAHVVLRGIVRWLFRATNTIVESSVVETSILVTSVLTLTAKKLAS